MARTMVVESDLHLTRIAVLEDGQLAEIHHESRRRRHLVGSIYKGKVRRVLPGIQAAFVDVGLERDAFLFVDDAGGRDAEEGGAVADQAVLDDETSGVGRRIDSFLKTGQELLVQVTKEPLPQKGARVTTQIALPGRYLVLLPGADHVGVSKRIDDPLETERLRQLALGLKPATGMIVRTEAAGAGSCELLNDLVELRQQWQEIEEAAEDVAAPRLLHRDLSLTLRVVRDLFNDDFEALWLESRELGEEIAAYLERVRPELVSRLRYDDSGVGIFERFRIEAQIDAALRPRVWLKSGGCIVINPTEALVAIDVNTGRYVGRGDLEETILQTNLEAIREIGRQIRLRDLGGIIVIDLIDMAEAGNREIALAALEDVVSRDPKRPKILGISEFGLVEMTRKRSRSNLQAMLTRECPCCQGGGRIRSVSTICRDLRRAVLTRHRLAPQAELMVRAHPQVAAALNDGELLADMERVLGRGLPVQDDSSFHYEHFEIVEL